MEKCNLREKEDGTVTVEYTMRKRRWYSYCRIYNEKKNSR